MRPTRREAIAALVIGAAGVATGCSEKFELIVAVTESGRSQHYWLSTVRVTVDGQRVQFEVLILDEETGQERQPFERVAIPEDYDQSWMFYPPQGTQLLFRSIGHRA